MFLLSCRLPFRRALLALAAGIVFCEVARADLGVVLADPTGLGMSRYTLAGHTLVYLSGVCADGPVRARLCREGEEGSIVTTYPDFKERLAYSWNLAPVSLYLQGAMEPKGTLLLASSAAKGMLEAKAREGFFREVCAGGYCPEIPHSYWRNLVATTMDRDVFVYAVHTTKAEDEAAVAWLNRDPNVNHYNGMLDNCANFASALVNSIFPRSTHRDYLNDLGMMGPKAVARSFTRWALKRPELGFYSMHFAQMPGDTPRSGLARSGTEAGFHMKKYLIPVAMIGNHEVAGALFVAYYLTGRFGLYKEFQRHPSAEIAGLEAEAKAARARGDRELATALDAKAQAKRDEVIGTRAEWTSYREQMAAIKASAEGTEWAIDRGRVFPRAYRTGEVEIDAAGDPCMTLTMDGVSRRVGISSENVLLPGSDAALAFQMMMGRVEYALRAKDHTRETMPEFREDWALLVSARKRLLVDADQGTDVARGDLRP